MYHLYLETSDQFQIDDGDSSHLDIHQEYLDDLDDLDDLDEQLDRGSRILMTLMILMSSWIKDQGST